MDDSTNMNLVLPTDLESKHPRPRTRVQDHKPCTQRFRTLGLGVRALNEETILVIPAHKPQALKAPYVDEILHDPIHLSSENDGSTFRVGL